MFHAVLRRARFVLVLALLTGACGGEPPDEQDAEAADGSDEQGDGEQETGVIVIPEAQDGAGDGAAPAGELTSLPGWHEPGEFDCVDALGIVWRDGAVRTRTRFAAAEVPAGAVCQSEPQESTCEEGEFTAWTGTFTAHQCSVRDAE